MTPTGAKFWHDGPVVTTDLSSHILAQGRFARVSEQDPIWPDGLFDPFLLPDMAKAVELIWDAILTKTPIGIIGDYDMDGTPAAALAIRFFSLFGTPLEVILPSRDDGYGFSEVFVRRLKARHVGLVLTADCGIRDHAAVDLAKSYGMHVIISDHHECPDVLPAADAVINPKRLDSRYPERILAGTGVVFKIIQGLISRAPKELVGVIPKQWLAWNLDLVALATLADMVDLRGENRLLVIYGLKVIRRGVHVGISFLCEALGLDWRTISYKELAYKVLPKLNAAGRMKDMEDVLLLLSTHDSQVAKRAVAAILILHGQSQVVLDKVLLEAQAQAETQQTAPFLLVADKDWHPGVTGIVAGRLAEQFARPALVLAGASDGFLRGSARSFGGTDLPAVLNKYQEAIVRFGGHKEAVGLTVDPAHLETLRAGLFTAPLPSSPVDLKVTDGVLSQGGVSTDAIDRLDQLAPWGMGNPEPWWSITCVTPTVRWLGSEGNHAKLMLISWPSLELMLFDGLKYKEILTRPIDLCGTLSINEYRGHRTPQMIVKGVALAQSTT